ncbi:hypothetical protein ACHHYP_11309 [Achlya hypogyna]|uniref:Myb-like DNA-binding protein n=1 Tax=Achlya hypogyna TaxID=1202772 RepID=A0A1V9YJE1_ACHHY|nr:hypothetical protein ACHHYP_11309 [Achlya hypogyna]
MASVSLTSQVAPLKGDSGITLSLSPQHKISSIVDTAPSTAASTPSALDDAPKPVEGKGTWTKEEHERFLTAMEMYPNGPWKKIAEVVKSRTIRQTQTHAQKYREKLERRRRGLRTKHVVQNDMALRPTPYIPPYTAQVDSYYQSYHSPYSQAPHHQSHHHHHLPAHPLHTGHRQYEHSYLPPASHYEQSHYLPPPAALSSAPTPLPPSSHYNSHYDNTPLTGSLNLLWDPINNQFGMLHLIVDADAVEGKGTWTKHEHDRFLSAMEMFPNGPWKAIADAVGTRTIRQTQTHAQKYREKLARRRRGLRTKHILQPEELRELSTRAPMPIPVGDEEAGGWSDEGDDDGTLPPLPDCLDFLIGLMEHDPSLSNFCPMTYTSFDDFAEEGKGTWTPDEHERFLTAMQLYPNGPWKAIARCIKTRTVRQTQTHAQKYREKLARHQRGLRTQHAFRADEIETVELPELTECLDFFIDVLDDGWAPMVLEL